MIRGHRYGGDTNNRLQSWILEGKRKVDGKWIELDRRQNNVIGQLKICIFDTKSNEEITEIKLTQIGKNNGGDYRLNFAGFEIFGTLYLN